MPRKQPSLRRKNVAVERSSSNDSTHQMTFPPPKLPPVQRSRTLLHRSNLSFDLDASMMPNVVSASVLLPSPVPATSASAVVPVVISPVSVPDPPPASAPTFRPFLTMEIPAPPPPPPARPPNAILAGPMILVELDAEDAEQQQQQQQKEVANWVNREAEVVVLDSPNGQGVPAQQAERKTLKKKSSGGQRKPSKTVTTRVPARKTTTSKAAPKLRGRKPQAQRTQPSEPITIPDTATTTIVSKSAVNARGRRKAKSKSTSRPDWSAQPVLARQRTPLTPLPPVQVLVELAIDVRGSCKGGPVWGSNPYTTDSDVRSAAVHCGLVRHLQKKIVLMRVLYVRGSTGENLRLSTASRTSAGSTDSVAHIIGSERNGVASLDWDEHFPMQFELRPVEEFLRQERKTRSQTRRTRSKTWSRATRHWDFGVHDARDVPTILQRVRRESIGEDGELRNPEAAPSAVRASMEDRLLATEEEADADAFGAYDGGNDHSGDEAIEAPPPPLPIREPSPREASPRRTRSRGAEPPPPPPPPPQPPVPVGVHVREGVVNRLNFDDSLLDVAGRGSEAFSEPQAPPPRLPPPLSNAANAAELPTRPKSTSRSSASSTISPNMRSKFVLQFVDKDHWLLNQRIGLLRFAADTIQETLSSRPSGGAGGLSLSSRFRLEASGIEQALLNIATFTSMEFPN